MGYHLFLYTVLRARNSKKPSEIKETLVLSCKNLHELWVDPSAEKVYLGNFMMYGRIVFQSCYKGSFSRKSDDHKNIFSVQCECVVSLAVV